MSFSILYASQWAFSEEVGFVTTTPVWVPIIILLLMLLIFVWGLTRGNVVDENMPDVEGSGAENNLRGDGETH